MTATTKSRTLLLLLSILRRVSPTFGQGDGLYLLEVEVPAGLGPDDLIQVEVPGKDARKRPIVMDP